VDSSNRLYNNDTVVSAVQQDRDREREAERRNRRRAGRCALWLGILSVRSIPLCDISQARDTVQ